MNSLTKDEVILQLANLASGIERTTGDSLKAKALREAIAMLDTEPKTYAEKRYNIHGCGSANEVIKKLQRELSVTKRNLQEANAFIYDVQGIVNESEGVVGYHKNGNIALWSEWDFLFKDKDDE